MTTRHFMKRALSLARRGIGRASPNPMVGAVVVRDGVAVGEGWHRYDQVDHAEVLALNQAGEKSVGADLYVNLEPCSHQGRTPPCVERILESRIARVFVAVRDPNPLVAGQGVSRLRSSGVDVVEGACSDEAESLNEAFFHSIERGTPLVQLKMAMTLDGRIATAKGESKWITGSRARRRVHNLRFASDAILVGVNTILEDDPSLDVRGRRRKTITKAVLDSKLQTPRNARIFGSGDPVILFHSRGRTDPTGVGEIAELVGVDRGSDGLNWSSVLSELGGRRVRRLLIEGGGRVAASALRHGVVRRVSFFYGPKLIGADGVPGIGVLGVGRLDEALELERMTTVRLGSDLLLEGELV